MARGLEPAFATGQAAWPLAGMALAGFERDDPDISIPHGTLQIGLREAPERYVAANSDGRITHRATEPMAPRPVKPIERKWKLALLASCVFHVAVASFFVFAITDEAVLEEGSNFSGIALLGSPEDMVAAGDTSTAENAVDVTMVTMLDAVPVETVEAQAVPVADAVQATDIDEVVEATDVAEATKAETETLTPVEETVAEAITEAPAETVQAVERMEPETVETASASAMAEAAPEVLATDRAELVDDDNFVLKPAETARTEPAETTRTEPVEASTPNEQSEAEAPVAAEVETLEVAKAEPTKARPVEPVEDAKPEPVPLARKAAQPPTQDRKPAAEKKTAEDKKKQKDADGKKVARKAEPKPRKSGNGGRSEANAVRGQADGQERGDSGQASRGGSKNGAIGNAAVSNYPGKVRSKLARVARTIRAKGRGEVVVAFAVGSSGDLRAARVARSSGVASVDQAALQAVRKASPFPPIPENAGRSSWEFSVPLAFTR